MWEIWQICKSTKISDTRLWSYDRCYQNAMLCDCCFRNPVIQLRFSVLCWLVLSPSSSEVPIVSCLGSWSSDTRSLYLDHKGCWPMFSTLAYRLCSFCNWLLCLWVRHIHIATWKINSLLFVFIYRLTHRNLTYLWHAAWWLDTCIERIMIKSEQLVCLSTSPLLCVGQFLWAVVIRCGREC